jgi:hypothetical protein
MKNLRRFLETPFAEAIIISIRAYQKIFSPDHGILRAFFGYGRCRFYPSCSEYAILSIRQYGLFKGGVVSLLRILKCNPFHAGGYDPVRDKG